MKTNTVETIIEDFRNGQNIFRRPSVELLVREVSRLQSRIAELEEKLRDEKLKNRWIPVSEWQIKEDGIYFYLDKHGYLQTAYFYANAELNTIKYYVKMIFTMPLPQPPKEE